MTSLMLKRAALCALLTGLMLWPALAQQELAITIARIGGTVEVQHASKTKGAWVKAKKDQVIGSGWNLRTAADSKAQLVFPQDNVVILKANSLLTVDNLDAGGGAKLNAKSGGLLVDIKKALSPGSTFEVKTPSALAVVRGTKFGVEIASNNDSALAPGGPLVAMNFMLNGQPMRHVKANPDFSLLLGTNSIFDADADGDGAEEQLLSGAALQALLADDSDSGAGADARAIRADEYVRNFGVTISGMNAAGHEELELTWDELPEAARSQQKPTATEDRRTVSANDFHHNKVALTGVGDVDGDGLEDYAFKDGESAAAQFAALLDSMVNMLDDRQGGVGEAGDAHEQQADATADRVGVLVDDDFSDTVKGRRNQEADTQDVARKTDLAEAAKSTGDEDAGGSGEDNSGTDASAAKGSGASVGKPQPGRQTAGGGGAAGMSIDEAGTGGGRKKPAGITLGDLDGDGEDEIGVDSGDVDQDGLPDYMVWFSSGPRQTTLTDGSRESMPLKGGISGTTQRSIKQGHYAVSNFSIEIDGVAMQGAPIGDVDGDGMADIVVGSQQGSDTNQRARRNTWGSGGAADGMVIMGDVDGDGTSEELEGEFVDDSDGDGIADLVVKTGKFRGITQPQSQTTGRGAPQGTGPNGQGLRLADLDEDGVIDALDEDSDGDGMAELVVGDLDGDGTPERAFRTGTVTGVDDPSADGNQPYVVLSSYSHGGMAKGIISKISALAGPDGGAGGGETGEAQDVSEAKPQAPRERASGALDLQQQPEEPVATGKALSIAHGGTGSTNFHGYEGTVEISNEHGTSLMPAGTSVDADGGSAPSDASPSGDDAQQFLEETEDTALFDEFDAAADGVHADLGPIRAALLEQDRKLTQYEADFAKHVRQQDIGKMMLIWVQLPTMREIVEDNNASMWELLGGSGEPGLAGILIGMMQEQGVPDTDLPLQVTDLLERIEAFLLDLEPYLKGQDELLDRAQGLIDPGDPKGSIRNDLIDTDNDGIGDALELELGLDPLLSTPGDFIVLIAPDDGDAYVFPPDGNIDFEFEALDSEADLLYSLVLEAGGVQTVRSNARERERFTYAQLAGPGGLLEGAVDNSGLLSVNWHVEARLRRNTRGPLPNIRSETRSFEIQTPANGAVEVNLRAMGTARVGTPINVVGDITEVNALGEWEIEISYDPALVAFTQGSKTGLFNPSTVFFNDSGNGRLTVSGQVPAGSAGITGLGDIFTLSFNPLAPGQSEVEATKVTLRDSLGRDINGRGGDIAEINTSRGAAVSPLTTTNPSGAPITPSGGLLDNAGLPQLGPLMLSAPGNGTRLSYPGEAELAFDYEELDTDFDVFYNLILSAGGVQKKYADFAAGDAIQLSTLIAGSGPFAKNLGAQGLVLDWRVEALVDRGGSQPDLVSSETWQVTIAGPQNATVTLDLSAMGSTSQLAIGDPLRIRGSLSDVEGLGEFQFLVRFDAGVLDFSSGRKVGLFSGANVRIDDAGPGKVVISGSAADAGISGSGACFELEFEATGDGSAVIEPDQVTLLDILGLAIDGSAGDSVDVDVAAKGGGNSGVPGAGPAKDPFGNDNQV